MAETVDVAGPGHTTAPGRLVPVQDDVDTAGFWDAARRRELAVCACRDCAAVLHMPRARCRSCGSWNVGWRTLSGRGRLYSWTTVEHQVHPAYPTPYTLVLVEPEDAPTARLVGSLPGRPEPELVAGQPMQVWFEEVADGVVLPQWAPVPASGPASADRDDREDAER
jgi:uncharacterized OB-fold protein